MDTTAKGYWNRKKKKIISKYPLIKEQDLHFNEGGEKRMIDSLSYKLGKSNGDLLLIIAGL
jgi:hypothetical protein